MRIYTPEDLRRFLEGVDAALRGKAEVVVIGGAAAAIEYGVASGTRDIDTWTKVEKDLGLPSSAPGTRRGWRCRLPRAVSQMDRRTSSHAWAASCRTSGDWR